MQKLLQKIQLWIEREIRVENSKPENFLNTYAKDFGDNFPSLGMGEGRGQKAQKSITNVSPEWSGKLSVINELRQKEQERQREDLTKDPHSYIGAYIPGNVNLKDTWNNIENTFFKTSKLNSEKEVQKLATCYPELDLKILKFIYIHLSESYEDAFCFLKEHYSELYIRPQKKKEVTRSKDSNYTENFKFDDSENIPINFDKSLLNLSVAELRSQVIKHKGVQYIFSRSYRDAAVQKRSHDASRFKNFASEQNKILSDYQAASKAKYLHELRSLKDYQSIDLHHFFLDEAIDLLSAQIKYILEGLQTGFIDSSQYKFREVSKMRFLTYEVITGRGAHSKNGKAILFPGIVEFVTTKGIKYRGSESLGRLEIYLPVK